MSRQDALETVLPELVERIQEITLDLALDTVRLVIKQHTPMSLEAAVICTEIQLAVEKL